MSDTPARQIEHRALQPLKEKFPQHRFMVGEFRDMVTVIVPAEAIVEVVEFLRDDAALQYNFLCDLHGVDYLDYPGARHRFGINYGLTSLDHGDRLWLRVYLDPTRDTSPENPADDYRDEDALDACDPGLMIDSITSLFPGAEWMEREVYDFFGIVFRNHPDLRRLFTWNGFGSFPLRKDYPLRGVGEREDYKIVTREGA